MTDSGKTAVAASAGLTAALMQQNATDNLFVHHVYFWLNKPDSKEDFENLVKGLQKLSKISYIKLSHIGKPASTKRDVIDTSYNVSWLLFFATPEEQDKYQHDPVHLKFVEECKHLWSKVVVYDSVNV